MQRINTVSTSCNDVFAPIIFVTYYALALFMLSFEH